MRASYEAFGKSSIELFLATNVMAEVNEATGLEFEDFEKLLEIAEKRYSNSTSEDFIPYYVRILFKLAEINLKKGNVKTGVDYLKKGA